MVTEIIEKIQMILEVIGITLFIVGLLFCLAPKVVAKLNRWGKIMLFTDEGALKNNIKSGVLFIILGMIIYFINHHYLGMGK